jgi:hypothetical protein
MAHPPERSATDGNARELCAGGQLRAGGDRHHRHLHLLAWAASEFNHKEDTYYTYFTGSVAGLVNGGPVRYRGVPVGKVGNIEIDPQKCRAHPRHPEAESRHADQDRFDRIAGNGRASPAAPMSS